MYSYRTQPQGNPVVESHCLRVPCPRFDVGMLCHPKLNRVVASMATPSSGHGTHAKNVNRKDALS